MNSQKMGICITGPAQG